MKRFTASLALVLALITILSACGPAASNSETTEATQMKNIYQKSDPSQDDTLNILMIGNSLCYYYVEELYGMLKAAGIKANVCNVYQFDKPEFVKLLYNLICARQCGRIAKKGDDYYA